MKNKVKFFIVLFIAAILAVATISVYSSRYGSIGISGFVIKNDSGEMNWPLVALIAQWFVLFLAVVLAAFHYLSPYQHKY